LLGIGEGRDAERIVDHVIPLGLSGEILVAVVDDPAGVIDLAARGLGLAYTFGDFAAPKLVSRRGCIHIDK
jgi:hypothetical protein